MKLIIRPYITFAGNCQEAINLYKETFQTETLDIMRTSDLPAQANMPNDLIIQATLKLGDNFIRMSDCMGDESTAI